MRQLFTPVQPIITLTDNCAYTELFPDARLAEYIYCYWRLKSCYPLPSPFTYRVVPDGCIDIFFNMNNKEDSRVMGFSTSYTSFFLGSSFDYVGIRFMPTAFPFIFNVDASALTDKDENLHDVVPVFPKILKEKIKDELNFDVITKIFDQYFLHKIASLNHVSDPRLTNAISLIVQTHGTLNLRSSIDTGISQRQLRRLFDFYVGTSPKMFSKVIRFQYFFQLLISSQGAAFNKVLYDAGYYDQSHFNRDFKSFFGLAPSQALNG